MTDSWVYAVRCGRYVKIGCTNNIRARLVQLQRGNDATIRPSDLPNELFELLGFVRGDIYVEAAFHAAFADERVVGEWFLLNNRIRNWTDRLLHSLPDGIAGERLEAENRELKDRVAWLERRWQDCYDEKERLRVPDDQRVDDPGYIPTSTAVDF